MTNNTLFCGLALLVIGCYSYFIDAPGDMKEKAQKEKVAAIEKAAEEKGEAKPSDLDWRTVKLDDPRSETVTPGKVSMTALIPAALGLVLVLLVAVVIYKPDLRKHAMHAAAVVGLVGVIGGLYPVVKKVGTPDLTWENAGVRSGVLTALASGVYVGFAVKSFVDARKARAAGGESPAA